MFKQEALIPEMGKLHKFALRLTRNASDADDLLQSTVLRALEKSDYFHEGTNLFSWMSKIMFNLFASQYRRRKKYESQYDPAPYIDRLTVRPTQEIAVDLDTVRKAMKRLNKDHSEILLLVCVQGLSYKEVSEKLSIPTGTVRSRLSRARQQIQAALEPGASGVEMLPAPVIHAAAPQNPGLDAP